jgi:site-specific recombinase XerD
MARRRARGDGSTYQDCHGQWWAKIPLGNNKTRRARCADRKDAEATLKKLIADRDDHRMDLSASQQSVTAWLEKWLEAKKGTVAETTWEFYQRHCSYAVPHIGHIKLEALEAHHIRAMLAALGRSGLSPQSCEHVRCVLRSALNMALTDHLVRENVAKRVDSVRVTPYDAPILTEDETRAILDGVDGVRRLVWKGGRKTWARVWVENVEPERLGAAIHLALALGFRRSELLDLRWTDWNRKERLLTIRNSKTPSGKRILPLTDDLNARLEVLWSTRQEERKLPHWHEHGYIFCSEVGTQWGERNFNRWFDRIQADAGIEHHIRPHDLRHTAISDWFAAGADSRGAQDLAGHASPVTTQRIYAKTRASRLREVIEETEQRRKRRSS